VNMMKLKPRYTDMSPELIRSVKSGQELLKQPGEICAQELRRFNSVIELQGGKVSSVYQGFLNGEARIIKFSFGLYRAVELRREAEALLEIDNHGSADLVPTVLDFQQKEHYTCLTMSYINGETARKRLASCADEEERAWIWQSIGESLARIHRMFLIEDSQSGWLEKQLDMAELNKEQGLIDPDEFTHDTADDLLVWLKNHMPKEHAITIIHGDFRTKNLILTEAGCSIIDWSFVDIGSPYYDLAVVDYSFVNEEDRKNFYLGYDLFEYNPALIDYYDKLSKFINV